MTFGQFDAIRCALFTEVTHIAETKGEEYAHSTDRLANFKRQAMLLNQPALMVWAVYFMKHIDAIMSFVKTGREFSDEGIRGRFVDAITYLLLGYAIIKEKEEQHDSETK